MLFSIIAKLFTSIHRKCKKETQVNSPLTSLLLQVPKRHRISSKLTAPFTQIIISDAPSLSTIDTSSKLILCDWRNYANSVPTNSKTMAVVLSVHYTYYSVYPSQNIHSNSFLYEFRMAPNGNNSMAVSRIRKPRGFHFQPPPLL